MKTVLEILYEFKKKRPLIDICIRGSSNDMIYIEVTYFYDGERLRSFLCKNIEEVQNDIQFTYFLENTIRMMDNKIKEEEKLKECTCLMIPTIQIRAMEFEDCVYSVVCPSCGKRGEWRQGKRNAIIHWNEITIGHIRKENKK